LVWPVAPKWRRIRPAARKMQLVRDKLRDFTRPHYALNELGASQHDKYKQAARNPPAASQKRR
jgi:hypothetical protein